MEKPTDDIIYYDEIRESARQKNKQYSKIEKKEN